MYPSIAPEEEETPEETPEETNKHFMNKTIRRQIRTTLLPAYEKMLAALCDEQGKKESEIVRDAVVKYLRSSLSGQVIQSEKEMSLT